MQYQCSEALTLFINACNYVHIHTLTLVTATTSALVIATSSGTLSVSSSVSVTAKYYYHQLHQIRVQSGTTMSSANRLLLLHHGVYKLHQLYQPHVHLTHMPLQPKLVCTYVDNSEFRHPQTHFELF